MLPANRLKLERAIEAIWIRETTFIFDGSESHRRLLAPGSECRSRRIEKEFEVTLRGREASPRARQRREIPMRLRPAGIQPQHTAQSRIRPRDLTPR
jgi:hypothetical protein